MKKDAEFDLPVITRTLIFNAAADTAKTGKNQWLFFNSVQQYYEEPGFDNKHLSFQSERKHWVVVFSVTDVLLTGKTMKTPQKLLSDKTDLKRVSFLKP